MVEMSNQPMGTGKRGVLCAGSFERGNGTYWEVRREEARGKRTWILYRISVAVTEMGEYATPDEAYAEYFKRLGR
jgi:hypothetical protein